MTGAVQEIKERITPSLRARGVVRAAVFGSKFGGRFSRIATSSRCALAPTCRVEAVLIHQYLLNPMRRFIEKDLLSLKEQVPVSQ